jgi:F-type H+-transporting ATPase subunit epsilon
MQLEIITPAKRVFKGEVDSASFPGSNGAFQVLQNHAALISSLTRGKLKYRVKDQEQELLVNGGVVEVRNNKIIVLLEELIEE